MPKDENRRIYRAEYNGIRVQWPTINICFVVKYEARLEDGTVVSKSEEGVEFQLGDGKSGFTLFIQLQFPHVLSNFRFSQWIRLSMSCNKHSSENNEEK